MRLVVLATPKCHGRLDYHPHPGVQTSSSVSWSGTSWIHFNFSFFIESWGNFLDTLNHQKKIMRNQTVIWCEIKPRLNYRPWTFNLSCPLSPQATCWTHFHTRWRSWEIKLSWMWNQTQIPRPWIWFPGAKNLAPNSITSIWLIDLQHCRCNCKNAPRHLLLFVSHDLLLVLKCVREVAWGLEEQVEVEGPYMGPGSHSQLDVCILVLNDYSTGYGIGMVGVGMAGTTSLIAFYFFFCLWW